MTKTKIRTDFETRGIHASGEHYKSDLVELALNVIRQEGFRARRLQKEEADIRFTVDDGRRTMIRVLCGAPSALYKRLNFLRLRYPAETGLILVVYMGVKFSRIHEGKHVQYVTIADLREWLKRYKPEPKAKKPTSAARVRTSVRTNKDQIIIAAESLSRAIDEKLDHLNRQKPNSDEAIADRDKAISDYESLKAQVKALQDDISKFKRAEISESKAVVAATTFGSTVDNWWQKDHCRVLSRAADFGLIMSVVGMVSLIGVQAQIPMLCASAIVGGKPVVEVLKAYFKSKK
jgi:hypothetical protein